MKKNKRILALILSGGIMLSTLFSVWLNVSAQIGDQQYIKTEKTLNKIALGRCNTGYATNGNIYVSYGNETIGVNNWEGENNIEPVYIFLPEDKVIKDVEKGFFHTVILTTDGDVYTLGNNEYGQLGNGTKNNSVTPVKLTFDMIEVDEKIVEISANGYHTIALSSTGAVYSWGMNKYSQVFYDNAPDVKEEYTYPVLTHNFEEKIVHIETGAYSSFVITENGKIYGWGFNGYGNLGTGNTNRELQPVCIYNSYDKPVDFSAGKNHAVLLTESGKVYSWGRNDCFQITDEAEEYYNYQYEIPSFYYGNNRPLSVVASGNSTCVITDNEVYIWGNVEEYYTSSEQKKKIELNHLIYFEYSPDFSEFEIAMGENHFAVITDKGKIYTFGENNRGQLALKNNINTSAVSDATESFYVDIAGYADNSVKYSYAIECAEETPQQINYNIERQYGNDKIVDDKFVFYSSNEDIVKVDYQTGEITEIGKKGVAEIYALWRTNERIVKSDWDNPKFNGSVIKYKIFVYDTNTNLSSGKNYSIHLKSEKISGWGQNKFGQLGFSKMDIVPLPVEITSFFDEKIVSVKTGYHHTLILTDEGNVYAFGYNDYGQLGDNSTTNKFEPVLISGFDSPVEKIEASARQSFAITQSGKLYAWGRNNYGQLGDGTKTNRFIPTLINGDFANIKIKEISSGDYSAYAITENNEVYSWGFGSKGNLGDGTVVSKTFPNNITQMFGEEKIIKISAGNQHAVALSEEMNLYGWGYNNCSQLGYDKLEIVTSPELITNEKVINAFADENNVGYITENNLTCIMGENSDNKLGAENTNFNEISNFLDGIIEYISFGESHTVVETKEGKVYTLGSNNYGQLGFLTSDSSVEFNEISSEFYKKNYGLTGNNNSEYYFLMNKDNPYYITVFAGDKNLNEYEIIVRYDSENLLLEDLSVLTPQKELETGVIYNTPITILGIDTQNGKIRFKWTGSEYNNLFYNGVVNAIKFKAIKNGWAHTQVELSKIN